jgi:hypothetical protein
VVSTGRRPEAYDLWYHDAPVWVIRKQQKRSGPHREYRVTLVASEGGERRELLVQPDAHVQGKSLSVAISNEHTDRIPLDELERAAQAGELAAIRRRLKTSVDAVLQFAKTAPLSQFDPTN